MTLRCLLNPWRFKMLSPRYTTRFCDLLKVR
ncbi:DUF4113 domain-containing protein [Klebsiella pneumoniae]|nr:DUF4113 domain-containing protein [Klebsiella pneumoniae]